MADRRERDADRAFSACPCREHLEALEVKDPRSEKVSQIKGAVFLFLLRARFARRDAFEDLQLKLIGSVAAGYSEPLLDFSADGAWIDAEVGRETVERIAKMMGAGELQTITFDSVTDQGGQSE